MSIHLNRFYPVTKRTNLNNLSTHTTQMQIIDANKSNLTGKHVDFIEYEKELILINKKLRSYEKRHQKLFVESNMKKGVDSEAGKENDGKILSIEDSVCTSETDKTKTDLNSIKISNSIIKNASVSNISELNLNKGVSGVMTLSNEAQSNANASNNANPLNSSNELNEVGNSGTNDNSNLERVRANLYFKIALKMG